MKRRDVSLSIALGASLLLHGMAIYALLENFSREIRHHIWQPGYSPDEVVVMDAPLIVPEARTESMPNLNSLPPMPEVSKAPKMPDLFTPPPSISAKKKNLPDRVKLPDIEDLPEEKPNDFGEAKGKGTALHSAPGDEPMMAHKGPENQAFLSRDPSGPGREIDPPSMESILRGDEPDGQGGTEGLDGKGGHGKKVQLAIPSEFAPTVAQIKPFGINPSETILKPTPRAMPREIAAGTEMPPPPANAPMQVAMAKTSGNEPNHVANKADDAPAGKLGKPGNAGTPDAKSSQASDPAPMSDSESDAFSTVGSIEFRPGKVNARFGRQVKTVRPRLSLAGQYDLLSLQFPTVVMKVKTDATGKVIEVDILKSSGSNEVDQPCKLAMYDWWFEPPKDKQGKPQPAKMEWSITWMGR